MYIFMYFILLHRLGICCITEEKDHVFEFGVVCVEFLASEPSSGWCSALRCLIMNGFKV